MTDKILHRATDLAFEDWENGIERENPASIDNRLKPANKEKFNRIYKTHLADLNRFNPAFDKAKEAIARAKEDRSFN